MNDSILIIGAGAAGLMAAKELSANNQNVTILEASNRIGGRIYTLYNDSFIKPVEVGAEFIHGNLHVTRQLLNEANIPVNIVKGEMMRIENGERKKQNGSDGGWDELMKRMQHLKNDMTVADFLTNYFSDEKYSSLRRSVQGFAEGFDLADISQASVFALRNEWMHEEGEQFRVGGGYQKLVNHLLNLCKANGCTIHTSCIAKEIYWKKNEVKVVAANDKFFESNKVIITVPLGVLQAELNSKASITFTPSIYDFFSAAKLVGYGTVIKIFLQFNDIFWDKNAGFILSNETIPTWWTQLPDPYPLLTGWLNGTKMKKLKSTDTESIFEESLHSLSSIFKIENRGLKEKLTAWKIVDWSSDPFALGAYSFDKIETATARNILNTPIQETIFFAGEALYEGESPGTVEAALVSGREVAEKVIAL
jgi:monoamine oxidase